MEIRFAGESEDGTFETCRRTPKMSAYWMKTGSGWPTVKVPRMTRLRLWPQEEPTVTSTDGRHLAAFFLP